MVKQLGPTNYTIRPTVVAIGYECSYCKKSVCRLWREYKKSFEKSNLYCFECATINRKVVNFNGNIILTDNKTRLVPAILGEDGYSFHKLFLHLMTQSIGGLVLI
jgi:hypothetical protein